MKNWKTTIAGMVLAVGQLMGQGAAPNSTVAKIAQYLNLGGAAALGIFSKDSSNPTP